ncbi:hypothetical protein [Poriferisphaera sp. WC338]|uniref:hypothetical protein n=1 Tax=Poriferisphaera sp. WC338 TaxID=3425129 RepID=UPI003D8199BD
MPRFFLIVCSLLVVMILLPAITLYLLFTFPSLIVGSGNNNITLGIDESSIYPNITQENIATAEQLTDLSSLSLPKQNITYLSYQYHGFKDHYLALEFEMDKTELSAWIAQTPILSKQIWDTNSYQFQNHDWQYGVFQQFRYAEISPPDFSNPCLRILIDDTNPKTKVVYLEWFTM